MDINSVPARIIILGTSERKLTERFSAIEHSMAGRKPRAFLYDDDLAGGDMYSDRLTSSRNPRSYHDLDAMEDDSPVYVSRAPRRAADPIYGADGSVFQAPRTGNPRRGGGGGGGGRRGGGHPAYALLDEPRRAPRPRVREEIIEYVTESIPPRRQPATRVIRRVVPQRQQQRTVVQRVIQKPQQFKSRGGGGRAPRGGGGGGGRGGGRGRGGRRGDNKPKPDAASLDADLDAYMKVPKHPRVSAATAE